MDPIMGPRYLPIKREKQGHGVLGDGMGRVGRDPGDGNPQFLCGRKIDAIEACAPEGYVLHTDRNECFETCAVHVVIHKGADRLRTTNGRNSFN